MRSHRGMASVTLSIQVIEYLVKKGYSQADIARMIGLSEGFVSLVKSRERAFTVQHLRTIADRLNIPLGAFLLSASPLDPKTPKQAEFAAVTERVSRLADKVIESIRSSKPATATK
jgi:transcriptional regulator with XRE-family HTH domain